MNFNPNNLRSEIRIPSVDPIEHFFLKEKRQNLSLDFQILRIKLTQWDFLICCLLIVRLQLQSRRQHHSWRKMKLLEQILWQTIGGILVNNMNSFEVAKKLIKFPHLKKCFEGIFPADNLPRFIKKNHFIITSESVLKTVIS